MLGWVRGLDKRHEVGQGSGGYTSLGLVGRLGQVHGVGEGRETGLRWWVVRFRGGLEVGRKKIKSLGVSICDPGVWYTVGWLSGSLRLRRTL